MKVLIKKLSTPPSPDADDNMSHHMMYEFHVLVKDEIILHMKLLLRTELFQYIIDCRIRCIEQNFENRRPHVPLCTG